MNDARNTAENETPIAMTNEESPTWDLGYTPVLTISSDGGIICECGNTPESSGFECCDESGTIVQLDEEWPGTWKCLECNRYGYYPDSMPSSDNTTQAGPWESPQIKDYDPNNPAHALISPYKHCPTCGPKWIFEKGLLDCFAHGYLWEADNDPAERWFATFGHLCTGCWRHRSPLVTVSPFLYRETTLLPADVPADDLDAVRQYLVTWWAHEKIVEIFLRRETLAERAARIGRHFAPS